MCSYHSEHVVAWQQQHEPASSRDAIFPSNIFVFKDRVFFSAHKCASAPNAWRCDCRKLELHRAHVMLQVIPFLVLAVGVDNMFILANTLDTTDASAPLPERIGQALSSAGPSITLAATAGEPPAAAVSAVEGSVIGPVLVC